MEDIKKIQKELEFDERKDRMLLEAGEEFDRPSRRGSIVPKVKVRSRRGSKDNLLDFEKDEDGDYDYDFDNDHFLKGSINSNADFPTDDYEQKQQPNTTLQGRSQSYAQNPFGSSAPQNNLSNIRATNVAYAGGIGKSGAANVGRDIKESLKRSRQWRRKRSLSADAAKIAENRPF